VKFFWTNVLLNYILIYYINLIPHTVRTVLSYFLIKGKNMQT